VIKAAAREANGEVNGFFLNCEPRGDLAREFRGSQVFNSRCDVFDRCLSNCGSMIMDSPTMIAHVEQHVPSQLSLLRVMITKLCYY
jgi:hypothetical protein